jgi:hypothetical protein
MKKALLNRMQEKTERHRIRRNAKRKHLRAHPNWVNEPGMKPSPLFPASDSPAPVVIGSHNSSLFSKFKSLFRRKV